MNEMTTLTTALLDLLKALEGSDVPLIVGGGFGNHARPGASGDNEPQVEDQLLMAVTTRLPPWSPSAYPARMP